MARRAAHQPYSNQYQNGYNGSESYASDSFEAQNDNLIDGLRSKVNTLKSLTLDMGDEIKDQNSYLKEVDNSFDSTWGLLSSSMKRVTKLAKSGHNRHILYLLLFAFFVFFVIYLIMKFR